MTNWVGLDKFDLKRIIPRFMQNGSFFINDFDQRRSE